MSFRTSVLFVAFFTTCASLAVGQPRGYGLVAKVNTRETNDLLAASDLAHVTAVQSWFSWSELETADQTFDFSSIHNWLDTIDPKKGVLVIMPINGKSPLSDESWNNTATPDWLLDDLEDDSPTGIVS